MDSEKEIKSKVVSVDSLGANDYGGDFHLIEKV